MMDIALHDSEGYVSLRDVSKRQAITIRYLEIVVSPLIKKSLLKSFRGKDGGYRLAKPTQDYTMLEIIECVEGALVPVSCMAKAVNSCAIANTCATLPMWEGFYEVTKNYFGSISLQDMLNDERIVAPCVDLDM